MLYIGCIFVTDVTGTELFSHADATIQDKPNTEEESFTATDTSDR